jgi:hypothetical protein
MAAQPARIVCALAITAVVVAGCTSGRHRAGSTPAATAAASPSAGRTAPTTAAASAPARRKPSTLPAGAEAPTARGAGKCKITSTSDVAAAYRGKVTSESAATSGIGNPQCQFALSTSNAGVPGTVTITMNAPQSPATFARARQQARGATVSGAGDAAFYVASSATLEFRKGRTVATIRADLRVPGRPAPLPSRVRSDSVALARAVAADL